MQGELRGLSGEELAAFAASWMFREKLQRTFDGFWCSDDVSLAFPQVCERLHAFRIMGFE